MKNTKTRSENLAFTTKIVTLPKKPTNPNDDQHTIIQLFRGKILFTTISQSIDKTQDDKFKAGGHIQ